MNLKQISRITVDIMMTISLLLLMTYEMIGQTAHEVIGVVMFLLLVFHNLLNRKWIAGVLKGKYSPYRTLSVVLIALIFLTMVGSAVSGIALSRHVFLFVNIGLNKSLARIVHMLSAYWGFILISLHLGLNLNFIFGRIKRKAAIGFLKFFQLITCLISIYGIYVLFERRIIKYLFLIDNFVFFDFNESLILFIIDYIAVVVLFCFIGYYSSVALKKLYVRKKQYEKN